MAADVRKEQTFFFLPFSTRLLSFTALPCGHDENNSLPEVCNCSKPGCDSRAGASGGSCISGKPATRENPRASDRLCYDRTSRRGVLSNQRESGLCPKTRTQRFYMGKQAKGEDCVELLEGKARKSIGISGIVSIVPQKPKRGFTLSLCDSKLFTLTLKLSFLCFCTLEESNHHAELHAA